MGRWGNKKQRLRQREKRVSSVSRVPERPHARPREGPGGARAPPLGRGRAAAGGSEPGWAAGHGEKPSRSQRNRSKALQQPPSPAPQAPGTSDLPLKRLMQSLPPAQERSNPCPTTERTWTATTDREKQGNNTVISLYICNGSFIMYTPL